MILRRLFVIGVVLTTAWIFILLTIYSNESLESFWLRSDCSVINKNVQQYTVVIDQEVYPKLVPSFHNKSLNFACLNARWRTTKLILLWNTWYSWQDWKYGLGRHQPFRDRQCPVDKCEITYDRDRLAEADLVLVDVLSLSDLPTKLSNKTRLVLHSNESPILSPLLNTSIYSRFDFILTYRLDSAFTPIYLADVQFKWERNNFDSSNDYLKYKTKFAAILMSNCNTDYTNRLQLVHELRKHVPVDIFGKCGLNCTVEEGNYLLDSNKCRASIAKEYMFYLAFENSLCKDYVTEKLLETVLYDIVPVVYGGADYTKWLPRSSYINIADFKSIKDLADYMTYLSSNNSAYSSYFNWKQHIKVTNRKYHFFCDMCIRMHLHDQLGSELGRPGNHNYVNYFNKSINCVKSVIQNGCVTRQR